MVDVQVAFSGHNEALVSGPQVALEATFPARPLPGSQAAPLQPAQMSLEVGSTPVMLFGSDWPLNWRWGINISQ